MIKCEATEQFTLKEFNKLRNIKRYNINNCNIGTIYTKDRFECDEEMAIYLSGKNNENKIVVKVIEVIPDKKRR